MNSKYIKYGIYDTARNIDHKNKAKLLINQEDSAEKVATEDKFFIAVNSGGQWKTISNVMPNQVASLELKIVLASLQALGIEKPKIAIMTSLKIYGEEASLKLGNYRAKPSWKFVDRITRELSST